MRDLEGALFCVSCEQFQQEIVKPEPQIEFVSSEREQTVTWNATVENSCLGMTCGRTATNIVDNVNREDSILRATQSALLEKIDKLQTSLVQSENMQEWALMNEQLSSLLSNLQKVRCLRNVHSSQLS